MNRKLAVTIAALLAASMLAIPQATAQSAEPSWYVHDFALACPDSTGSLKLNQVSSGEDSTTSCNPAPAPTTFSASGPLGGSFSALEGAASQAKVWIKSWNNAPAPNTRVDVQVLVNDVEVATGSLTQNVLNGAIVEYAIPLTYAGGDLTGGTITFNLDLYNDDTGGHNIAAYMRCCSSEHPWQITLPLQSAVAEEPEPEENEPEPVMAPNVTHPDSDFTFGMAEYNGTPLQPGDAYSYLFDIADTYEYHDPAANVTEALVVNATPNVNGPQTYVIDITDEGGATFTDRPGGNGTGLLASLRLAAPAGLAVGDTVIFYNAGSNPHFIQGGAAPAPSTTEEQPPAEEDPEPVASERNVMAGMGFLTPAAEGLGFDSAFDDYAEPVLLALLILILILFIVLLIVLLGRGGPVAIGIEPRKVNLMPGDTAEFNVHLRNRKKTSRQLQASFAGADWQTGLDLQPKGGHGQSVDAAGIAAALELSGKGQPGDEANGTLRVHVPEDLAVDSAQDVELTVTPLDDDGLLMHRKSRTVHARIGAEVPDGAAIGGLSIDPVHHEPNQPLPGQEVSTTTTVRNDGDVEARLRVVLMVDDNPVQDELLTVPARSSALVGFPWVAGNGRNRVKVQVFSA